MTTKKPNRI